MTANRTHQIRVQIPQVAEQFEHDALRHLVALRRELQRPVGDGPFYLSVRTAGRNREVDPATACRWLFLVEQEGILEDVSRENKRDRKASRYRSIAESKRMNTRLIGM